MPVTTSAAAVGILARSSGDLAMGLRVLRDLPAYLRHPLTIPDCCAIVSQRLARRERTFLEFARVAVYANPASPYRALMALAGCEFGDLEGLVLRDGIEQALLTLFRAGVYLTVDEFKGRCAIVRGASTVESGLARVRNPLSVPHLAGMTSGSRGSATRVLLDLACIRDHAVNMLLALDGRGGGSWRNAVWCARGVAPTLWYSGLGTPTARWFLYGDPGQIGWRSGLGWTIRLITWTSRAAGIPIAAPLHAPVECPRSLLDWIRQTRADGHTPHLWGASSLVVGLCQTAVRDGADLDGVRFTITGEPVTATRLEVIRRAGGEALPDYGSADSGGSMSYGCLSPEAPDDMHVFADLNALIQADCSAFPPGALLATTLTPTVPFVMINVAMGDRATLTSRRCGCPFESLGWTTHIHTVRSYEKLTAAGVTFDDGDVVALLDDVLPRAFGGGPSDYQLVEDESPDGQPRLRLLVDPAVGSVDEAAVSRAFLDGIGSASEIKRSMADVWSRTGTLCVERQVPRREGSGKIHHLVSGTGRRIGTGV
jgi:hypothetical protein